jgi:phospholipase C
MVLVVTEAEALSRLQEIEHIVVLMKENRSFDQMLGYLHRDGMPEVDGLTGNEVNHDGEGKAYPVFEWKPEQTVFHPDLDPTGKVLDPCHSPTCVKEQLSDGNGGFVKNFLATRKDGEGKAVEVPAEYRGLPMGYYSATHLPVYDHLARNYCVCDAWHASIPGDTWPNRLYSLAGRAGESIGHRPGFLHSLGRRLSGVPGISGIAGAPIFEVEAFTRQLEDSQWRWYSHDPATLRAADARYRELLHIDRGNFAYFNRKRVSALTETVESPLVGHDSFLDDAAKGQLRDVSWIDPNFIDLRVLDPNSNDDHPPSDIRAGQALVLELYEALAKSPNWENTLLVIAYDEHGGFYDHVAPPPVGDDGSGFTTLGVRVPALLVGPRVAKQVCHTTFEHTSLIATILRRFAADPEAAIARMPKRVHDAPHLGQALAAAPRADIPDHAHLRETMDSWRARSRQEHRALAGKPSALAEGVGRDLKLHDFQEEFLKFSLAMREQGLPPGQP